MIDDGKENIDVYQSCEFNASLNNYRQYMPGHGGIRTCIIPKTFVRPITPVAAYIR